MKSPEKENATSSDQQKNPDEAKPSTEPIENRYTNELGAIAAKLCGSFFGLTVFAVFLIASGFLSDNPPFPVIQELHQLDGVADRVLVRTVQFVFLAILIIHHWRVFAGTAFVEDDNKFVEEIQHLPHWKRRLFRILKFSFLLTYPLFVLSCRLPQVNVFRIVFLSQTSASICFDIFFFRETERATKRAKLAFTVDTLLFALSVFLFFAYQVPSEWLIFSGGGVFIVFFLAVAWETVIYKEPVKIMFHRTGKYLWAKETTPAAV